MRINENLQTVYSSDKVSNDFEMIARKTAINFRDELISAALFDLNIDFLIDIGCDFGSLLAAVSKKGIIATGLDVDKTALRLARSARLDARSYSIQRICGSNTLANFIPQKAKITSVSCLNILHSNNFNKQLRNKLLDIMLSEFDYVIISCDRKLLNKLKNSHNLEVVRFISQINRPISRINSILQQYGTTFFFTSIFFHNLEQIFWKTMLGKFTYINPVASYSKLCVIVKKSNIK